MRSIDAMSFSTYATIITYIITGVGFTAICLVEELSPSFLAVTGILTGLSLVVNTVRRIRLPRTLRNILALAIFALFLADYLFISRTLIGSASVFLTLLVVLKLYDMKTTRDYVILYSLAFFQLVAAAASTVSPAFFAVFSIFVISAIWAMVVFNIKRDVEEWSGRKEETIPAGIFGPKFVLSTLLITLVSILITLALFFMIPRIGIGVFKSKTLDTLRVTGFSERFEFGSIGSVKLDPTVVMRVHIPGYDAPPKSFYFRGNTLYRYDGSGWSREKERRSPVERGPDGRFVSGIRKEDRLIEQRIMLEPLDTSIIFADAPWVSISGRFSRLWTDPSGALHLDSPPYSRIEYTVWSLAEGDGQLEVDKRGLTPYLQLPPETVEDTERIKALALSVTKGADSAHGKAMAIEGYLRANYRYTLKPRQGRGGTPLEDFLFYTKEGYCEQFATSMAILLRTIGIPSRIVTGYLQGEWNRFGHYFIVRQQDSHSWVEAYIDGTGWTRFDPTPNTGIVAPFRASSISLYIDTLRWKWSRYIINYSLYDQIRIARTAELKSVGLRTWLRNVLTRGSSSGREGGKSSVTLTAATLIVFIAALAVLVILLKRRHSSRIRTPGFYMEMLRILSKKGLERKDFETPMEFAARSGLPEAVRLTEVFQRIRYGGTTLDRSDMDEVKRLLEAIKKCSD